MNIVHLIKNAGISDKNPDWLNAKIGLSNTIALIFIPVCIAFTVVIYLFMYPLLWLIGLATAAFVLAPVLNHIGQHIAARMAVVFTPFSVVMISGAYFSQHETAPPYGLWGMAFAFLAFTFALFDHRERTIQIAGVIAISIALFTFKVYEPLFNNTEGIDLKFVFSTEYTLMCTATGILAIVSALILQQNFVIASEENNMMLVNSLAEKQTQMEESEATLKNTLSEVQKAREDEQSRTWVSNGVAQLTALTREEENGSSMNDKILSFIIKYLNANQGAFYEIAFDDKNSTKPYISLKAVYAYDRKKHAEQQRIEIGQGLVGQCYLEKTTTRLKKLPQDYVRITSGLGDATPSFLAIVPLIYNREVEGIIEVASFKELTAAQIEFMEKGGEALASYIKAYRTNKQTLQLLETSQIQAEEMRSAEEEMRQNMEELAATQEEMERKQREIERQNEIMQAKEAAMEAMIEQLQAAKKEIEEVRATEKARTQEQIERRNQIMQQAVTQFKKKEQDLLAKIEAQAQQITALQTQPH
ncbi:GAF domain-containing protein [Flexibacter flexilis]|nr:GAF domain-containing protein [Flexibacter flexilis]